MVFRGLDRSTASPQRGGTVKPNLLEDHLHPVKVVESARLDSMWDW
jgi:hypothetical protein